MAVIFSLLSSLAAYAGETISTDHRLTFVKIDEFNRSEQKRITATHPHVFTDEQMRAILSSIRFNRAALIGQEVESDSLFTDRAVEYLTPRVVEAFRAVKPGQKVVFSYLAKDPQFFVREDRVTIAVVWVDQEGLHFRFDKVLAKISGDYDKQGTNSRVLARARGLRMALEIQPNQRYGATTDELIFDPAVDYAAGQRMQPPSRASVAGQKTLERRKAGQLSTGDKKDPHQQITTPTDSRTVAERLQQLEDLKKAGLVNEEEYQAKRQQILNSL